MVDSTPSRHSPDGCGSSSIFRARAATICIVIIMVGHHRRHRSQWLWVRVQNHFSGTTMNHSRAATSNLQSRCGDDDVGLIDGEGGWCELSRVREPHRHRRSVAARVTRCRYMTRLRRRGHFRLVPDTERGGSNTTVSFTSLLFHRSHQVTFCTSVYKG